MNIQHYLVEAIEVVLAQELPEEAFINAVNSHACLLAKVNPEELLGFCQE